MIIVHCRVGSDEEVDSLENLCNPESSNNHFCRRVQPVHLASRITTVRLENVLI